MKILRAKINNFLTIGTAELELDDRGLLLIVGDNADDTSANSNGAGKSSLVDALCWALYGVTARDVSGDDVVNESAKKDCCVTLTIEDDGALYEVIRHRKHKVYKNALLVNQIDTMGGACTSITKGTDKETQLVVNSLVGCSVDVFTSAVYAGQERMPDLPSMTDKALKVLIEEAAGIQVLEEAHTIAKQRLSESKEAAATQLNKVNILDNNINNIKAQIADTQVRSTEFDDGKRDRAKAHLATAKPHIETIKKASAENDRSAIEAELMDLSKDFYFDHYEKELAKLNAELPKLSSDKTRASTRFEQLTQATKKLIAERNDATALVGKPCNECGKEYCTDDIQDTVSIRDKQIQANKAELIKIRDEYDQANQKWTDANEKINKVQANLSRKAPLEAKINKCEQRLRELDAIEANVQHAKNAVDRIKAEAQAFLTQENPFIAQIADLNSKLSTYEKQKLAQQSKVNEAMASVELCSEAVNVFGPAGVRAHILDTVTPFLNARTNDYLGTLSDGNVHATWTTLSTTAKGETREKFSIAVSNDKGGSSFKKLSGGEKRKVRLATAMALQDLVASRATKPVQLFIADEIDYALDDSGLERLMGVLERKARERGTVLIISHQSGLRDWCDQVINVTKNAGKSEINGDNFKTAIAA